MSTVSGDTVAGAACALASAALAGTAIVVQAMVVREVDRRHAYRVTLLLRLARSKSWLASVVLIVAAWALQAVALHLAPLTVVQPALATTLVVVLMLSVLVLHDAIGGREMVAAVTMAAGLAVLVASAPARSQHHAAALPLDIPLMVLGAAALAPLLARGAVGGSIAVAFAAGAGFALCSIATKLFGDALAASGLVSAAGWLAVVIGSAAAGGITQMSALQSRTAAQVVSIAFATETVVPVGLAPVLFDERWSNVSAAEAVARAAALAALVAATWILATSRAVAGTMAGRRHEAG